ERGAKGCLALLAVDLAAEARPHGERRAAARPMGCTGRPGAGAARSLLAPRLRTPTGDETPALDGTGPGAVGAEFCAHGLVNEMRLHLGSENQFVEGEVLRLLAGAVENGSFKASTRRRRLEVVRALLGRPFSPGSGVSCGHA